MIDSFSDELFFVEREIKDPQERRVREKEKARGATFDSPTRSTTELSLAT